MLGYRGLNRSANTFLRSMSGIFWVESSHRNSCHKGLPWSRGQGLLFGLSQRRLSTFEWYRSIYGTCFITRAYKKRGFIPRAYKKMMVLVPSMSTDFDNSEIASPDCVLLKGPLLQGGLTFCGAAPDGISIPSVLNPWAHGELEPLSHGVYYTIM